MSKEKPILFNTEMVRAILEGRKSQTRRVIKPQPVLDDNGMWCWKDCQWMDGGLGFPASGIDDHAPYQPGDILWVRETWFREDCTPDCAGREDENECPFNRVGNACYGYKAQYLTGGDDIIKWRPSIHMPKEAARIFLGVTDVRVERVQSITDEDGKREGVCGLCYDVKTGEEKYDMTLFKVLWDGLNAKRGYGWDKNPYVWVYSFERVDKPAGWPGGEGGE